MKTNQQKLTKIGMILLMVVAFVVNTENANGKAHCTNPTKQSSTGPIGTLGIKRNNPKATLHIGLNSTISEQINIAAYSCNTATNSTTSYLNLEGLSLQSYTSSDTFKRFKGVTNFAFVGLLSTLLVFLSNKYFQSKIISVKK